MKKHLSVLVIVLAITAIFTSSVLAAPATSTVNLVSISYNEGGVVLTFETSGLTKADLKNASILVAPNWHKMYCTFVEDTTKVRCTVSKSMAGKGEFYAVLAGVGFWGELPQPRSICLDGQILWYSYSIYHNGAVVGSGKMPVWVWEASSAFFVQAAQQGYDYRITDSFCGSNV